MHRDDAWKILMEHASEERTWRHGIAVESVMRAYGRHFDQDEDRWGLVGLLHDFDWEIHTTEDLHPEEGSKILEQRGVAGDIRYAILCHAPYLGLPYTSDMDRAIFASDELAGFVMACAMVKPGKSLSLVTPETVRKKMKDKSFARSVSREDLRKGAEDLGVDFDDHVRFVAEALKPVAPELGIQP
ncbi:MAG: HAD family hydrolase [Dehalococcoidia bacterium]|nr:HAD family hydrolase [Dehalococcoidia bacterium]